MKPRPRLSCRPGALCSATPGTWEHRQLGTRTLFRRGRHAIKGAFSGHTSQTLHDPTAVTQCLRDAGSMAARTQDLAGATLLRNLEPGLEQLPAKQRDVLVLVWLEELSYDEVAGILGISVGTVKLRLNRALEQLHRWLASAVDPPGPSVN